MPTMTDRRFAILPTLCAGLALTACAPTLETPNDGLDGDAGGDVLCPQADPVCSAEMDDGVMVTHVAALDQLDWVYFDFETMTAPTVDVPRESDEWDVAFRRFVIKVNGGVSGMGGVEFAIVENLTFTALTLPPVNAEWLADLPDDAEDPDVDPEFLMATGPTGWFDYNPANHVLTPRDRIYVLRSVEGIYYKIQMQTYYDSAGSPAHVRFHWGQLADPS